MRDFQKILVVWILFLFMLLGSLLLPQRDNIYALYTNSIQFLLFTICLFIIRREVNANNKAIFLNFALFFSLSILFQLYNFIGVSIFDEYAFATHYYFQYVMGMMYPLLLAIAIVYIVIDLLFRGFNIGTKYLFTLTIVIGLFAYYYAPYFQNPKYLYSTPEVIDFKTVYHKGWMPLNVQEGSVSTPEQIADMIELPAWQDGKEVGTLHQEAKLQRVKQLYPYLYGENYLVLLMSPLYRNLIYMNVLVIFFLFLYFGYLYKKDPPQGAYIDKIAFLFLIFSSMDALHSWAFIKAVDWSTFNEIFHVGQYISLGVFLLMVLFFGLRLRFITSAQGEFYEHELVHSPEHITRWRDWVDNLVLSHFFNAKAIRARFFAQRGRE